MTQCKLCARDSAAKLPLCRYCKRRAAYALEDAAAVYTRAHMALTTRSSSSDDERVRSSRPMSKSPLRDDLLEHSDELARALATWATYATGDDSELPVRWGAAVQRSAQRLLEHLDAALRHPVGVIAASRVITLVATLRHRLGETQLVHQLTPPCPNCDTRALVRRDGDDYVFCRMCDESWTEQHYELLVKMLVSESHATWSQ